MQKMLCTTALALALVTAAACAPKELDTSPPEASVQRSESLLRIARAAHSGGDLQSAADLYQQAASKAETVPEPWLEYADFLTATGNTDSAVKVLERAAQNMPKNTEILRKLGYAYIRTGAYGQAVARFDDAIALKPEAAILYAGKGVALDMMDNQIAAQEAYLTGLRKAPDDPMLLTNLGMSLVLAQQYQAAIEYLSRVPEGVPAYAKAQKNLALAREMRGNGADVAFGRAVDFMPVPMDKPAPDIQVKMPAAKVSQTRATPPDASETKEKPDTDATAKPSVTEHKAQPQREPKPASPVPSETEITPLAPAHTGLPDPQAKQQQTPEPAGNAPETDMHEAPETKDEGAAMPRGESPDKDAAGPAKAPDPLPGPKTIAEDIKALAAPPRLPPLSEVQKELILPTPAAPLSAAEMERERKIFERVKALVHDSEGEASALPEVLQDRPSMLETPREPIAPEAAQEAPQADTAGDSGAEAEILAEDKDNKTETTRPEQQPWKQSAPDKAGPAITAKPDLKQAPDESRSASETPAANAESPVETVAPDAQEQEEVSPEASVVPVAGDADTSSETQRSPNAPGDPQEAVDENRLQPQAGGSTGALTTADLNQRQLALLIEETPAAPQEQTIIYRKSEAGTDAGEMQMAGLPSPQTHRGAGVWFLDLGAFEHTRQGRELGEQLVRRHVRLDRNVCCNIKDKRVRLGPFTSFAKVSDVCDMLANEGVVCHVVQE